MTLDNFKDDVIVTITGAGESDWALTYNILQKVDEINDRFFEELEMSDMSIGCIDPVAIVYTIIVEASLDELNKFIEDVIRQYCDRSDEDFNEVMEEYQNTKSKITVYGNYSDTQIDSYSELSDFLDKTLKRYKGEINISKTLDFFLTEIGVN